MVIFVAKYLIIFSLYAWWDNSIRLTFGPSGKLIQNSTSHIWANRGTMEIPLGLISPSKMVLVAYNQLENLSNTKVFRDSFVIFSMLRNLN